jgi:hypothetical protein
MVTTCIFRGLARKKIDRFYLFCLPFGYIGMFLLLHWGTDLSLGMVCAITLLIGDAPGALLTAIIAGFLALVAKPAKHPGSALDSRS